jgi:hypothetical protein
VSAKILEALGLSKVTTQSRDRNPIFEAAGSLIGDFRKRPVAAFYNVDFV